jgi:hypothetical protein
MPVYQDFRDAKLHLNVALHEIRQCEKLARDCAHRGDEFVNSYDTAQQIIEAASVSLAQWSPGRRRPSEKVIDTLPRQSADFLDTSLDGVSSLPVEGS